MMAVTSRNGCVGSSNANPLEECNGKESLVNGKTKQKETNTKFTSLQNGRNVDAPPVPPLDRAIFSATETYDELSSLLTSALAQLGLYLLLISSYLNQMIFPPKTYEKNRKGYAPLYNPYEQFYFRYVIRRSLHICNYHVCSAPSEEITLNERTSDDYNWTFRRTGRQLKCVNLGSYNYVGYRGGKEEVEEVIRRCGLSLSSPRAELGSHPLHAQLEKEIADFLGVEAAVVVGNGFSTNSLMLPGFLAPGTLVLSDENNHTSIIVGLRLSKACVRVFRHNDTKHLEQLARQARAEARWEKIIVVLEGVYSMEGSLAALSEVIALKKSLGLHVYIDEAHSIGLGPRGRGATDACGVSARDVDAIMGSFSKSFPGAGGYIAGSADLVNWLRAHGYASVYAHSMPPPIAMQIICALRDLRSPSGQTRVAALKENTRYFRERLRKMGLVVLGHPHSPVIPVMTYFVSKIVAFVEELTAAGIASVGVGFPATPLYQTRIRFCLSAAHTREQLDKALEGIESAVDKLGLRYSRLKPKTTIEHIIDE